MIVGKVSLAEIIMFVVFAMRFRYFRIAHGPLAQLVRAADS